MAQSASARGGARGAAVRSGFRGRGALRIAARFGLAAGALALVLWAIEPLVFGALARAARDLIVVSTSEPRVTQITWLPPTFAVTSPLHDGTLGLTAPWFRLALVAPLALALALPGAPSRSRLAACAAVATAIFVASALALANDVLAALVERLGTRGLVPLPPWRASLHTAGRDAMWEVAMVYLPGAACLLVSLPVTRFPSAPAKPAATRATAPRRRRALLASALVAAAALAVALDRVASARIADLDPEELLAELEPWNPDLGGYLVRVAEAALASDRTDEATRIFRLALRYESSAGAATDGLRRARARARAEAAAGTGAPP